MILEVKNVTKRFGGLTALDNVTFALPKGQILGLIGPNGAGKTTLFNCINGVFPPTVGQVTFNEQEITGLKPYRVARLGIGPYPPDRATLERTDGARKRRPWGPASGGRTMAWEPQPA